MKEAAGLLFICHHPMAPLHSTAVWQADIQLMQFSPLPETRTVGPRSLSYRYYQHTYHIQQEFSEIKLSIYYSTNKPVIQVCTIPFPKPFKMMCTAACLKKKPFRNKAGVKPNQTKPFNKMHEAGCLKKNSVQEKNPDVMIVCQNQAHQRGTHVISIRIFKKNTCSFWTFSLKQKNNEIATYGFDISKMYRLKMEITLHLSSKSRACFIIYCKINHPFLCVLFYIYFLFYCTSICYCSLCSAFFFILLFSASLFLKSQLSYIFLKKKSKHFSDILFNNRNYSNLNKTILIG